LCGYDDPSGRNRNVDGWWWYGRGWKKGSKILLFFWGLCVRAFSEVYTCLGSICRYNSYDMAPHSRILLLPFVPSRKIYFSLTYKKIKRKIKSDLTRFFGTVLGDLVVH
jgi:hypothetical protein